MWQTFITGFIISALGSVPLGVINLTIIQISFNQGLKAAFQFIAIAIVAEYFHVWLALWLLNYINKIPLISDYFEWAAILFILVMGIGSLLKKNTQIKTKNENISYLKAIIINFLNPFSIPFWLFFTTYALNNKWIYTQFDETVYCVAATAGALITLSFYALGGSFITKWGILQKVNIDKVLGFTFIAMAGWKLVKLWFSI